MADRGGREPFFSTFDFLPLRAENLVQADEFRSRFGVGGNLVPADVLPEPDTRIFRV